MMCIQIYQWGPVSYPGYNSVHTAFCFWCVTKKIPDNSFCWATADTRFNIVKNIPGTNQNYVWNQLLFERWSWSFQWTNTACRYHNSKGWINKYRMIGGSVCIVSINNNKIATLAPISWWAIGGGWLQSPASQDSDGGKHDFTQSRFSPCCRAWIVVIFGMQTSIG